MYNLDKEKIYQWKDVILNESRFVKVRTTEVSDDQVGHLLGEDDKVRDQLEPG